MRDMCSAGRLRPRPSAGVSSLVAPVAPVWLDAVDREDLAGVEGDDRNLLLVDDGQEPSVGERRTDLEVLQAAGPSQGEGALALRRGPKNRNGAREHRYLALQPSLACLYSQPRVLRYTSLRAGSGGRTEDRCARQ